MYDHVYIFIHPSWQHYNMCVQLGEFRVQTMPELAHDLIDRIGGSYGPFFTVWFNQGDLLEVSEFFTNLGYLVVLAQVDPYVF